MDIVSSDRSAPKRLAEGLYGLKRSRVIEKGSEEQDVELREKGAPFHLLVTLLS
jgi:hypothetical protein